MECWSKAIREGFREAVISKPRPSGQTSFGFVCVCVCVCLSEEECGGAETGMKSQPETQVLWTKR